MPDLFTQSGAEFSKDRRYRYLLWRRWDESLPSLNFIMLNPSTADEMENDPTIERCERRARASGFGELIVTNLFALRSTDPQALYAYGADAIGEENDAVIASQAVRAGMVICAWGTHGAYLGRGKQVVDMLISAGVTLHALIFTAKGEPGHPLYLPYDATPFVWVEGKPEVMP
jgi:hypothetical protein